MPRASITTLPAAVLLVGSSLANAADLAAPTLTLDHPSPADNTHIHKPAHPATDHFGITGDWFGQRIKLEEQQIFVGGLIFLDVAKNFRGGLDTENYDVRYLFDLHVGIDTTRWGLPGGMIFADFQWHDETNNVDSIAGDIQAYDNLEGPRFVAIQQLWWKQQIADGLRIKIGRIDANTDAGLSDGAAHDGFSLLEHGLDFIHSSAAMVPTVFAMPTYPNPAPGITLFYGKDEGLYAGGGIFYSNSRQTFLNFSGHPETPFLSAGGVFLISELGARWNWNGKPGYAGVGGWYHTGNFPSVRYPGEWHRGAGGGYLLFDQTLYQDGAEDAPERNLGCFFTAGFSDSGAAPMTQSFSGGLAATGFVPGRPDDALGIMSSWAQIPAPPEELLVNPAEWATEVFYKVQLTSWASVKPSFTYISSPSGVHRDAALASVRIEIDF